MSSFNLPARLQPNTDWEHHKLWDRINTLIYSLPNHFQTELLIKGINVTEIFSVGSAFATVVETQVVNILNNLRNQWDPGNEYAEYFFVRQSQTFPDVLLRNQSNERDIIFGMELKSWYVLSKEGEPSFRYQITPLACADADLLVIIPWVLSEVISGTPKLLRPYKESARYAAEYRNYYWQKSRLERGEPSDIEAPPKGVHFYPDSKQEASDEAQGDKGGNFGRVARVGILDDYIAGIKNQDYLGIKLIHWLTFFKAISETTTDEQIGKSLERLKRQIQELESGKSDLQRDTFLQVIALLDIIWRRNF